MKSFTKHKNQTSRGNILYAKAGEGFPAVILINGGSGPIEGWYKLFHELANETTVFAYNRFGVGGSDKPTSPQHGNDIVSVLRELLQKVDLAPPYILVGHSLGGLYANLFARKYPEEVVGMVLLDSSHPQDISINETQSSFIRGINRMLGSLDFLFPHRKWDEVHYVAETLKQIEAAGPFPDIPLYVISGGKKPPMMPELAFEMRKKNQWDLMHLSKQSKQIVALNSGHFPQFTEPELVIQTIIECITAVRANHGEE
ncbi:MAG: alpha/beta hydrolase [Gorillibacterium sp.]|nr:alpha/beta hydrolase [Gorillibacterium sp.]